MFGMLQKGLTPDLSVVEINDESVQGSYEEFLFSAIANGSGVITMTGTLGLVEPMHRALGIDVDRSVSIAAIIKYWGNHITPARANLIAEVLGVTQAEVLEAAKHDEFNQKAFLNESRPIRGASSLQELMDNAFDTNKAQKHLVFVFHSQLTNTSDYYQEALKQLNEMAQQNNKRDVIIHRDQEWVKFVFNESTGKYEEAGNVSKQDVEEQVIERMKSEATGESAVIITHSGDVFGMDLKTNGNTKFIDVLDAQTDLSTVLQGFGRDRGYTDSTGQTVFNDREVYVLGRSGDISSGELLEMVLTNEHTNVQKGMFETINRAKDFLVTNALTNMISKIDQQIEQGKGNKAKLQALRTMILDARTKYTSETSVDDSLGSEIPSGIQDQLNQGVFKAVSWMQGALLKDHQNDQGESLGSLLDAINSSSLSTELFEELASVIGFEAKSKMSAGDVINADTLKTPQVEFRDKTDFSDVDINKNKLYGAGSMADLVARVKATVKEAELPEYGVVGTESAKQTLDVSKTGEAEAQVSTEDMEAISEKIGELSESQQAAENIRDLIDGLIDTGKIKVDMPAAERQQIADQIQAQLENGEVDRQDLKQAIVDAISSSKAYRQKVQVMSSMQRIKAMTEPIARFDQIMSIIDLLLEDNEIVLNAIADINKNGGSRSEAENIQVLQNAVEKVMDIYGIDLQFNVSGSMLNIRLNDAPVGVNVRIENNKLAYNADIKEQIAQIFTSDAAKSLDGKAINYILNRVIQENAKLPEDEQIALNLKLFGGADTEIMLTGKVEDFSYLGQDVNGNRFHIKIGSSPSSELQFFHQFEGNNIGLILTPESARLYAQAVKDTFDTEDIDQPDELVAERRAANVDQQRKETEERAAKISDEFEAEIAAYSSAEDFMRSVDSNAIDDIRNIAQDIAKRDASYQDSFIRYMFKHYKNYNHDIQTKFRNHLELLINELTSGLDAKALTPVISLLYSQSKENIDLSFANKLRKTILFSMISEAVDNGTLDNSKLNEYLADYALDIHLADENYVDSVKVARANNDISELAKFAEQVKESIREVMDEYSNSKDVEDIIDVIDFAVADDQLQGIADKLETEIEKSKDDSIPRFELDDSVIKKAIKSSM